MEKLYAEFPFELAVIGVEVSGQFYLQDLETEMENQPNQKFYVGKDKIEINDWFVWNTHMVQTFLQDK